MAPRILQFLSILVLIFPCSLALGQVTIPDIRCLVTTNAGEPVSVMVLPDGSGSRFDQAETWGGGTTDATIVAQLLETENPISNFPAEDMWIESHLDGLILCNGGTIADQDTDAEGFTRWTTSPRAAGFVDPSAGDHLVVVVNGAGFDSSALAEIRLISPDLNGDLRVNVADVPYFSIDFSASAGGPAIPRSDFRWDGVLNLSDVGRFASAMGAACP